MSAGRCARWQSWSRGELPVLSAYLDMRPHATRDNSVVRAGPVILKNRLWRIKRTYLPLALSTPQQAAASWPGIQLA
jgi:hypothetical protein